MKHLRTWRRRWNIWIIWMPIWINVCTHIIKEKLQYAPSQVLNDWWSLCKITSSDARNTQQFEKRNVTFVSYVNCYYIATFVLACFRLTKCATFFRPETIVASFLHLMVSFYKMIINHTLKHQFVVNHCCTFILI